MVTRTVVRVIPVPRFIHSAGMNTRIATAKFSTELAEIVKAPDWIELIPAGPRVEARDGRWFLNDRPLEVLQAYAARKMSLPVDIEHATEIKGPRGEFAGAVGWVEDLDVRQGAIWGRVSWNDQGRWLIEDRSYRYVSPTFTYNTLTNRVVELTSVALTNQPALEVKGLFRAQPNPNPETKEEETMSLKAICRALGLNEGASEENILGAIDVLKDENKTALARAETPPLDKFVPRADHDAIVAERDEAKTALARIEDEAKTKEIDDLVDQAVKDGKSAPASREYHVANCRMEDGIARFKAFIQGAPKIIADPQVKGDLPDDSSSDDPKVIAAAALRYQNEQAESGLTISTAEAVRHVTKGK